jgi:hypothetical protein
VIRYDLHRGRKWASSFDGPGHGIDRLHAMAVDRDGAVYAAGQAMAVPGYDDMAVVAFSPAGERLWQKTDNGAGSRLDVARAIAVDGAANLLVAGNACREAGSPGGTDSDYTLLKYAPSGDLQWVRTLATAAGGGDMPAAMATDSHGNTIVTGQSWNGKTPDIVTVKYSP